MFTYWLGHEKYATVEACEVAAIAKEKGLILLEGNYMGCLYNPTQGSHDSKGYCVTKVVAGKYLVLSDGGEFQNYSYYSAKLANRSSAEREDVVNYFG